MAEAENKMIRAAILDPAVGQWEIRMIEKGLKSYQAVVNGYIEAVPLEVEDATLYVNEEGKLLGLKPAAQWIFEGEEVDLLCGTLLALGPQDEDGYSTDLTDEAFASIQRQAKAIPGGWGLLMETPVPKVRVFVGLGGR